MLRTRAGTSWAGTCREGGQRSASEEGGLEGLRFKPFLTKGQGGRGKCKRGYQLPQGEEPASDHPMVPRFDPANPPPTAFQRANRTRQLVGFVAVLQLLLGGVAMIIGPLSTWILSWSAACLVAVATIKIKKFFAPRMEGDP